MYIAALLLYCIAAIECLINKVHIAGCVAGPMELHPGPATAALMKLSFDEQHRHAICALGLSSSQSSSLCVIVCIDSRKMTCLCVFIIA